MKELSEEYLKNVSKKLQKETKAQQQPVRSALRTVRLAFAIIGIVVMFAIFIIGFEKAYITGMAILSDLTGAGPDNESVNESMDLEIVNNTVEYGQAAGNGGLVINARNEEAG